MNRTSRRVLTAEYKAEAIRLASAVGAPRQPELAAKSRCPWIKQSDDGKRKASRTSELAAEQQRIRDLERELAKAWTERDLLKKRRRSSRKNCGEVGLDRITAIELQGGTIVRLGGRV